MKIIDLAICVNNIDPTGIGRIRAIRYNDYIGEKEKAVDYEEWSDKDPFVCLPFLPSNINFIPETGQSVKIINYNNEKETVNQEYIAGPFGTMYDFNAQTFSQQIENTTYGVAVKHRPNMRNSTGQFINAKSENTFAKESDYAVYGKNGSDVLFTENGLQLRGGKLLSKEAASVVNRNTMLSSPIMAKKSARLYLKKFPKKMVLTKKETNSETLDTKSIKTIVEYEVNSLSNPTLVKFYFYNVVKDNGQTYKTNYFTENTPLNTSAVKLINTDNTTTTPTHTVTISSIGDAYKEIRDVIYSTHEKGLSEISPLYSSDDLHPLYFRPSTNFKNLIPANQTQLDNKNTILSKVKVMRVGPSSGLIWSVTSSKPTVSKNKKVEDILKIENNSPEQTFATVTSDKIYFLSTDTNETDKTINFNQLDQYDFLQEDYIKSIDPNTFSTVRGENLIKVLKSIVSVLFTHAHNINKPIAGQPEYPQGKELLKLVETLENDILNNSIRIN